MFIQKHKLIVTNFDIPSEKNYYKIDKTFHYEMLPKNTRELWKAVHNSCRWVECSLMLTNSMAYGTRMFSATSQGLSNNSYPEPNQPNSPHLYPFLQGPLYYYYRWLLLRLFLFIIIIIVLILIINSN